MGAYLIHTWRSRWSALLVIALMIAMTGGVTLAAIAGARRSASSLERFEDKANVLDVFVAGGLDGGEPQAFLDLLESDLVESHNDLVFLFVDDTYGVFFAPTSGQGLDVEEGVLVAGRRADPDDPHEIVLQQSAAREHDLGVGDALDLASISQRQADGLLRGEMFDVPEGPVLPLRVVGITRNGFELGASTNDDTLTLMTPAFLDEYGDGRVGLGAPSHMVRLADVPDAIDRFTEAITASYDAEHLPSINVGQRQESVTDAISVITAALAVVALVIAVAGVAWIGSAAMRHQRGEAEGVEVLRALGATPRERWVLLVAAVIPAVVAGVAVAPLIAVALSPAFPVGLSRRIDPDVGLHVDVVALGAGLAVLVVLIMTIVTVSAARFADQGRRPVPGTLRVPLILDRAAQYLHPASGTGVRFALFAPRRSSAPVRPALLGALVGVVGLVAVAVIGASLHRLIDTPARWGTTWDVTIAGENPDVAPTVTDEDRAMVLDNDDIEAAAVLLYDEQVTVEGVETIAMTLETVKGDLTPTLVEGREPRAADEIALARDTYNAVGEPIGARVSVGSRSQLDGEYRIVGIIAFPAVSTPTPLATGAALTAAGGTRLRLGDTDLSDDVGNFFLAIRWEPGVDPGAALERIGQRAVNQQGPVAPPEVGGLEDVQLFPVAVAAALAVLGSIATAHALLVTVRRRRLELGVLSSLGFAPSQRRVVIVVQATTIALVALALGVPLGVVVGRVIWSTIADSIGVATDASLPLALLAVGALGLLVVLNAIAAWPAHSAGRLRVAEALRSE